MRKKSKSNRKNLKSFPLFFGKKKTKIIGKKEYLFQSIEAIRI